MGEYGIVRNDFFWRVTGPYAHYDDSEDIFFSTYGYCISIVTLVVSSFNDDI
jgi:hypothetical protein